MHLAAMQDDAVYKKNVSCHHYKIALHVQETLLVRLTSGIPAHIDKQGVEVFREIEIHVYQRPLKLA